VRCLVALLLCLPMHSEELKVDHVTVAGRDLQAMRSALEAVGLKSETGGPHSNHATEMALTSFADGSYLELIAIQPQADAKAVAAHEWHKFMEGNAGPCAWAVRPVDLPREVARLRAAGITASEPEKSGRKRPDGVQLDWETAQIGSGRGTFYPFLIHDFTPRERRAGKPISSDFSGIVKVVLSVNDLDGAVMKFQRAYGFSAPQRQDDPSFGAKLAWFPGTAVVLAAPLSPQSWLNERLRRFGEAPCAFILGRVRGSAPKADAKWFGKPIAWFDEKALGWRLGSE
jgi:hypothetical protein